MVKNQYPDGLKMYVQTYGALVNMEIHILIHLNIYGEQRYFYKKSLLQYTHQLCYKATSKNYEG